MLQKIIPPFMKEGRDLENGKPGHFNPYLGKRERALFALTEREYVDPGPTTHGEWGVALLLLQLSC